MADYKRMYCILCAAADKVLELLERPSDRPAGEEKCREARQLLQEALDEAEDVYIETAADE